MQNITFAQLNKEVQLNRTTTPMMVSLTQSPDEETREMMIQRHTKFLSLPEKVKNKLASVETSQKIQAIGQKYQFELLRLANITRLIREYYFGEVRFEDFPTEIEKRVGVSLLTAQEITRRIKQEIIDWDPWAEYLARLPKMTAREMFEKNLNIAGTEITSGYVELGGSEDLEDPTIKNWVQDYISHVGYAKHSQMQRTEYLFHSENGKSLGSLDREKLGIILRSFDENVPLPVDEENGEIVFDGLIAEQRPTNSDQRTALDKSIPVAPPKVQPTPELSFRTPHYAKGSGEARAAAIKQQPTIKPIPTPAPIAEPTPTKPESFIKPYHPAIVPQKQAPAIPATPETSFINPAPQFQRVTPPLRQTSSPQPAPIKNETTKLFAKPVPAPQPPTEINYIEPSPQPRPVVRTPEPSFANPRYAQSSGEARATAGKPDEFVHPNLVTQPRKQMSHELNKYFITPETPDIPTIKIHSITERAEPQATPPIMPPRSMNPPQPNIQRPIQTSLQPSPYKGEEVVHPKRRIIDPFPERFSGPKIDGNVVDLSGEQEIFSN